MTLATTSNKTGPLIANGATTFTYTFKVIDKLHLMVIHTDEVGTEKKLNPEEFTITGLGNDSGGTVTYPKSGGPLPSGDQLMFYRTVPLTQLTDITTGGKFDPQVHEDVFDRLAMGLQQLEEKLDRAFVLDISTPSTASRTFPLPQANQLIGWNAAGDALENYENPDITDMPVSTLDIDGVNSFDVVHHNGTEAAWGSINDVLTGVADVQIGSLGTETLGVGLAHTDGMLHVQSGSAGAVTADPNADEIVVEGAGEAGISILGGIANSPNLYFGTLLDSVSAALSWYAVTGIFSIGSRSAGGTVHLGSDAGTTNLVLSGTTGNLEGEFQGDLKAKGVLTAGTLNTALTNTDGTLKGLAFESTIAGDGLELTAGVLKVVGGGVIDEADIDTTGSSINDIIYNNGSAAVWGPISSIGFDFSSDGIGILPDANVANNLTIDGGTIDGSVIGATTPAAATFTDLKAPNGVTRLGSSVHAVDSILHVHQDEQLGAVANNVTDIVTFSGLTGGNDVMNKIWLLRDAAGSDWYTTRIHDAIGIDSTYMTPGVDTKCWYERDPDGGIHEWGNGATTYLVLKSGQAQFQNGNAGSPSISFAADANTGLFRDTADQVGISTAGVQRSVFSNDWLDAGGHAKGIRLSHGKFLSFYQSTDYYSINFNNTANYRYGPVSTDFSLKMNMSNTAGRGWTMGALDAVPTHAFAVNGDFQHAGDGVIEGVLKVGNGSAGVPSLTFDSDANTGIYRVTENELGVATGGSIRYHQTGAWADFSGCSSGVAVGTADFLSLWGPGETYGLGMSNASTHRYGPITSYSIKLNMNSTAGRGITMGVQGGTPTHAFETTAGNAQHKGWLRVGDGSTSAPSLSFGSDTNTGIYKVGSDHLGFVSGGNRIASINANVLATEAGKGLRTLSGTYTAPTSYKGLEMYFSSGTDGGFLLSVDRGTNGYKDIFLGTTNLYIGGFFTGPGNVVQYGITNYTGGMGNSTKNPATQAPTDWVEIKIGGNTRYLPAYSA
jgi:hypothetical protein